MRIFVIFLVLILSVTIPTSFAQQTADCTFGGIMTPMAEKFTKDLAVQAFVEKYPNVSRNIPTDETGNMKNSFILTGDGDVEEVLEIQFHTDTNGCYVPASYRYSYDDGMIDFIISNSIGNFTEIMNLIKSDKITIEDFYPENCKMIHINATMTDGVFYGTCKSTDIKKITALVSTDSEGMLLMDIPLPVLYSITSTDCKITGGFETIVDNEFVSSEIIPTEKGHLVTVSLSEGFHKIEVLGFTILPDPSPEQYCGIVEGYDKKYLPPLAQLDHDMKPTQIRCNEGLVLLQKYDGSPSCVTESTKLKLIERGWAGNNETANNNTQNESSNSGQLKGVLNSCACQERVKANTNTIEKCPSSGHVYQNSTHYIDNNSCRWIYLEKYLDENNELNFAQSYDNNGMIIDDLQRIYDWCDYSGEKPDWYFSWNNQTHHIDSKQCKWYGCDGGDIYYRGVCMTPEAKEKAQSVGKLENEN